MEYKISVVVPCWGVEKYLDRCVESLVNQTLHDIEIILVNDASNDRTPELCDKWAFKDKRIHVVHKKKNEGLGLTRNTGLANAHGEYVMFLDSDDTYELNTCELMYATAKINDSDVVAGTFITEIRPGIWETSQEESLVLTGEQLRSYALDCIACAPYETKERLHPVSVCLLCIKREIIEQNALRFYSEREVASEDTLFKIALLTKCHKMTCLNFPFYHYFLNETSLTHTFKSENFNKLKILRARMLEILGNDVDSMLRVNRFIVSDIRMHITKLISADENNKLRHVRYILNDDIWNELKSFKPAYYKGIYPRVFYQLCLRKMSISILVFVKVANKIKEFLHYS